MMTCKSCGKDFAKAKKLKEVQEVWNPLSQTFYRTAKETKHCPHCKAIIKER